MSAVLSSFAAEWLKVRRRPAVWVLGVVLVLLVVAFEYGFILLAVLTLPRNASLGPGVTVELLRATLHPAHWLRETLASISGGIAGPIAVILGVLAYGSEYGWSTLKTVFTQRPGRLATLAGKLLALLATVAIYVVAMFAATAACSAAIGLADGAAGTWPAASDIAKALLTALLILSLWAVLGVLLSVLFRQSALAIGLGLIYAIVLEGVVLNLAAQFSWIRTVSPWFPGANASALVRSFGSTIRGSSSALPAGDVGPGQATLVLLAYAVAFVVVTAGLLRARDVT
ncbi:MAG TPA: ABC transporter permease [Candidatus Dormibacteraeota bacterium]|nr:ABC transporter permease [Candidatus Dormibacteraeota bacterium]